MTFMAASLPFSLILLILLWIGTCTAFVWTAKERVVVDRQQFVARRYCGYE